MSSNNRVKVAVLDDYQGVALKMADWSVLEGRVDVTVFRDHLSEPAAVVERLRPFDVVCVMRERTPLSRSILEQWPNLKLIASTAPRNASIDVVAAKAHGITVCGTGDSAQGAVELTWALILGIIRNLSAETTSLRNGQWQVSVGGDLKGKTLGVLGLGRIGGTMAKIAHAFGMNVTAWSQSMSTSTWVRRACSGGSSLWCGFGWLIASRCPSARQAFEGPEGGDL
jgi:lactate dehydrogenase-like 2-hydroxyacid dehydrogenase